MCNETIIYKCVMSIVYLNRGRTANQRLISFEVIYEVERGKNMKLTIILIILLLVAYELILDWLDYRNRKAPIPENVKDIYDEDTYLKRNEYERESARLSLIETLISLPLFLLVLTFNIHSFLFDYAGRFSDNVYFKTFFMLGVLAFLSSLIIGNIFSWYDTFVIEAKYGFNKTTRKTFVADTIKHFFFVRCLLCGGGIALFMYLYTSFGDRVFLIFFFVAAAFIVAALFFSHVFSKLFNKFTTLEDGSLKDKIFAIANKTGYPVKRVLVMDGSRRSTKLNAYFTGFGRSKTIVLFDTLIDKMEEGEITAVLAHEIGHAKCRHTLKGLPLSLLMIAALLFMAQFIVGRDSVSLAFGFVEANIAFGLYISLVISAPFMLFANIPLAALMRRFERDADAYAAENAGAGNLISALKKLARENYANLTPHPMVVKLSHSHPTISQRVEYISN